MKFTAPLSTKLADPNTEAVRQNIDQRITEIQGVPMSGAIVLRNVVLADNSETYVPHGLGRSPIIVIMGVVRGANTGGLLRDFGSKSPATNATNDRTQSLLLRTDGWGATITVDLLVA